MAPSSQYRYSPGRGPLGQPPGGPLARILAFIVGVGVLAVSFFVGAVFLAAFVGLVLIGALIFGLRVWWLKRKMEKYAREHGDLDAEYTVIREERITSRRVDDDGRN